ncbi:DNA-binding transcriptional MerR regulator [Paenibacillus phyllosphaerae]|uniref:DNA-binding transcriptional MerR regulator n=1 Tax=Paenibacillus phyllosphaerae TaxID=274593 RepID=A0A7W5FQC8_9BACL|nr:B12-binding domain-containing protein [Paenibacillus phyllosphaerae]MBB3112889.1 DNA-binding transcriptional MerR regulator [Paenibacillus phyllosphaerae]
MYSIKKAAELVDLPVVTIRAWENRYKIIEPVRSAGGHRIYSEADIATLLWLKEATTEKHMKIGEAVELLKNRMNERLTVQTADYSASAYGYHELADSLYGELTEFNAQRSHELIDLAFAMHDYEEVFHRLLAPVLYRIGEAWENGEITVAQEHFASQLIEQRFTQIIRILPTRPELPRVLAFCPEGELHHMGLILFSLFLRKKGLEVIYLGANTPLDGLLPLIGKKQIEAVAISLTDSRLLTAVKQWIASCRSAFPHMLFVLGGQGTKKESGQHPNIFHLTGVLSDWEQWCQTTLLKKSRVLPNSL